jgi:hypothetical protein
MPGENYSNIIDLSSIFCPQCCPGPCCIPCCDESTDLTWCDAVFEVEVPSTSIAADLCLLSQCFSLAGLFTIDIEQQCQLEITGPPAQYSVTYLSNPYPFGPPEPQCETSGVPENFIVSITFRKNTEGKCFMSVHQEGYIGGWSKELINGVDDCESGATEWELQPLTCGNEVERCLCQAIGPITVRRVA